ncbi:MAG TPA: hypothetical protein VLA24_17950 [Pseudomonadales bacterium]|nr:hypothetical protein [Pseudomonadales bacterium]
MSFIKWRAYIGPPFTRPSSAVHYDWSVINADATTAFSGVSTTLTAQLTNGATTATVNSASSFPSSGGFWVGSTRWTYVRYSGTTATTFTGLSWTGDTEEDMTHANGSVVKAWYDVPENNGNLPFTWELDSNLATMQWSANIGGGVIIPQIAIRNNHLIVVQRAVTAGGTFSNWLVGWLASPDYSELSPYKRQWTASIVSSAQKMAEILADGVRIGDLNIARDGSASAISSLSVPYKERYSGDYTAAEPDLSASAAIDGSSTTLWISEDVIGTPLPAGILANTSNDPTVELDMAITQVHIYPSAGEPDGYQWIEITVLVDGAQPSVALWTDNEGFANAAIAGTYTAGDKIIICADDVLFQQQNPRSSAVLVLSLEDSAPSFFSNLVVAGDSIGMYFTSGGGGSGWVHDVVWGTGDVPDRGASNPTDRYGAAYTGGNVTAPTPGQTMRYTFANSATPKNNWVTDFNDHAGYAYSSGNAYDEPWFLVELPSMGLMLAEDVAASYTGVVTLKDESGNTTGGLPDSGSIQIGNDICTFTTKTSTTITLTSAPAANHVEGDPVYVYFASVASDGVPVNSINWTGGSSYFVNFEIWGSRLPNARTPGTSGWQTDYTQIVAVTSHASATYSATFTTTRVRKVVLLPTLMSVDPSRMRMYEFEIMLDRTFYDTSLWLADGAPATTLFSTLMTNAHLPAGAISVTNDTFHDMSDLTTEKQNAWVVIADLADFTGHMVTVGRDSKIDVSPETFWTTGLNYTPVATWTRSNTSEIKILQDSTGVGTISQLRMTWKSADGATEGTSIYPTTPDWRGSVIEIGPYIYANSTAADAAARKQYFLRKYPYTLYVKPLGETASFAPGQIHRVQWDWDTTRATMDRYCMVVSVSNEFNGGQWTQSLNMIQVSREIPN